MISLLSLTFAENGHLFFAAEPFFTDAANAGRLLRFGTFAMWTGQVDWENRTNSCNHARISQLGNPKTLPGPPSATLLQAVHFILGCFQSSSGVKFCSRGGNLRGWTSD